MTIVTCDGHLSSQNCRCDGGVNYCPDIIPAVNQCECITFCPTPTASVLIPEWTKFVTTESGYLRSVEKKSENITNTPSSAVKSFAACWIPLFSEDSLLSFGSILASF